MTRQYWTNHKEQKGLITDNQHIAALIINSFRQPEWSIEDHPRYKLWKEWLEDKPKETTSPSSD